jgi:purine nucleosidase
MPAMSLRIKRTNNRLYKRCVRSCLTVRTALTKAILRSRGWLAYWQRDIGRQGFSPFDLLAAAYVVGPRQFGCAEVEAWIGEDATLGLPFRQPAALLVRQDALRPQAPQARGTARYCAGVSAEIKPRLVARLAGR